MKRPDPQVTRATLQDARLHLIFTPALCGSRDPLEIVDAALPYLDVLQVRVKALAGAAGATPDRPPLDPPCEARATLEWTRRLLSLLEARQSNCLVLVNDRVDVAAFLHDEGCAGVHVGRDDCPPALARELLGPDPLLGLSTHSTQQVAEALDEPVDYLGFGPFRATSTKGYARGLGSAQCWVAAQAAGKPVFPIGGIDTKTVGELSEVGRAAVGSAVLSADDPEAAAKSLRRALELAS